MRHSRLGEHAHRITHLIGESNYTKIYFIDSPSLLISRTLSYCIKQLSGFIRLHKMCAANPDFISGVYRMGPQRAEVIIGDTRLPISKRRMADVIKALKTAQIEVMLKI